MLAFSPNGPEFIFMATPIAFVLLFIVHKMISRRPRKYRPPVIPKFEFKHMKSRERDRIHGDGGV